MLMTTRKRREWVDSGVVIGYPLILRVYVTIFGLNTDENMNLTLKTLHVNRLYMLTDLTC